jgi:crotonobetainyl-CoA:carnitine CoA-transferase CaiB-like acyl-CoA transferase
MFEAGLEFVAPMLLSFLNAGVEYPRLADRHHAIAPYGTFICQDGARILLAIEHDEEWRRFCEMILNDHEMAIDARFATNPDRLAHRKLVEQAVEYAFARMTKEQAVAVLAAGGFAFARLNTIPDVADHPVVRERSLVAEAETAAGTPVQVLVGLLTRCFDGASRRQRPPVLNEDWADVFGASNRPIQTTDRPDAQRADMEKA